MLQPIEYGPHVAGLPARFNRKLYDRLQRRRDAIGMSIAANIASSGPLASAPAQTPLTIVQSTTVKLWSDTQQSAGANQWNDLSGNAVHFTEATNPPTLTTIGTVPCYAFNGTSQLFTSTGLTLTTGAWYWVIARQITWTTNGSMCGGTAGGAATVFQTGVSPGVALFNGAVADANLTAFTLGTWFRVKFRCAGDANDYLQIGASANKVIGNASGLTGTGWNLGARANTFFGNFAIASAIVTTLEPTAGEQNALDALYAAKPFGGAVTFG